MYFFHDLQKGICRSRKAPLFISLSRFSEVRCLPWSCALFSQTQTMFLFKYKYSAPLPIFQNTNHFKYKYSAPLLILRNTNYLFKCVLRLLVLLPLRSNKFLTAICWDFSSTSSLKCWIHLRVECIGNQSNCFTNLRKWNDSAVF